MGAALTSIGVLGTDICLTCRFTASTDFKVPGVTARLGVESMAIPALPD